MTPANEHHCLCTINMAIDALPEDEQEAIRAGVELAMAMPLAIVEVAAVLRHGGDKRGGIGMTMDGQTATDHIAAARRHLHAPWVLDVDPDSGRPTLAHVAGRAMLAIEADRGRGKGGS